MSLLSNTINTTEQLIIPKIMPDALVWNSGDDGNNDSNQKQQLNLNNY